tara:strand:- start:86 stop:961 length:876 start_codon:yes stop_codon:yes gene_type:complete
MIEDKENIKQETDNSITEESTTDTSSEVEKTEEEAIKVESKEEKSEQKDSKDGTVKQDPSNDDAGTSEDKTNSDEEVSSDESSNVNESARFILGKKVGMTSIYNEDGQQFPATVIEAGPCYVSQVKTDENDGYNAVQIGYVFDKKANKPKVNHFKKNNCDPMRYSKEFRIENNEEFKLGEKIDLNIFSLGEFVTVTGTSKGKGFAGVMKRHGFGGGRASHGKNSVMRKPGSVGAGADPSRIWKGKKMPGRYGGDQVTVKNLEVIKIDIENNLLFIKGAVPGSNNNLVSITF